MYFGVLAWALNALVMPWALDEHVTLRRRHIVIHVVRHAPVFVQYSATLAVVLGLIVTTIAHEAGHVMMLRRAGASHLEVALTWVGGMGRGLAIDTSPLATLRYAAGGPLASFAVGWVILFVRVAVPLPHGMRVVMWLIAALSLAVACASAIPLGALPWLRRTDGGYMCAAAVRIIGPRAGVATVVSLALALPIAVTLLVTLRGHLLPVIMGGCMTTALVVMYAAIVRRYDRRFIDATHEQSSASPLQVRQLVVLS